MHKIVRVKSSSFNVLYTSYMFTYYVIDFYYLVRYITLNYFYSFCLFPESQWRRSNTFIISFEHISHLFLVFIFHVEQENG